jgi:hypothetical protein
MRLTSLDATPNPNSMKLNLDEQLGAAVTYTSQAKTGCPQFVEGLLAVQGVMSVFVCSDFVTLNKDPRADWEHILASAKQLLSAETVDGNADRNDDRQADRKDVDRASIEAQRKSAESDGQVQVLVQTFRGIPIQIKVVDSQGETRAALSVRFNETAQAIQAETSADYLTERYWADYGRRYGERSEVAKELAEEIEGSFDETTFERAKAQALGKAEVVSTTVETLREWLRHQDWQRRLTAVQELSHLADSASLLIVALEDSHPQVRRLAAAALGASGSAMAVEPLCDVLLKDPSPGVRRTAGDALSDIGDPTAQPSICQALSDTNKLVRWRAARFLSDIGTADALPFLEKAAKDQEFEVRLEISAAIDRISGGSEGLGPAWKRIVEQT